MTQILAVPQVTTAQRNALVSPPNGTMIFNTDLLSMQITTDGGATWETQGANYPKETVYVSPTGVDVVGNGTQGAPYASLSFALSQITDATPTKPYEIIVSTGNYTEANIALKPSIYINLNNSPFTITTSLTLDPSWFGVNGNCSIENGNGCSFPASITLDFTAIGAGFSTLSLKNIISSTASTWNITGSPGGSVLISSMNFGFGTEWSYNLNKCYGGMFSGAVGDISLTDCPNFALYDLFQIGTTLMTSTSTMLMIHRNCTCSGAVTYQQTSVGTTSILSRANLYASGLTLDNGLAGGSVTLDADTLEALPTLLNTATYVPTSISDAMQANNYFNPVNYFLLPGPPGTWAASSPTGNFAGIDAALAAAKGTLLNIQNFTANGTYTPTVGCNSYCAVLTGGGGGGGGSGTAGGPGAAGGAGGTTSLGALASAGGGSGGLNGGTNPGAGGNTAGAGSGTVIYPGSFGDNGTGVGTTSTGGNGGTSYLGGCGRGGSAGAANGGVLPPTNSGGGGGGASGTGGGVSPGGGGCAGTTVIFFNNVVSSQSFLIGNGGNLGSAGTSGAPGTVGAKGRLTIYEYK